MSADFAEFQDELGDFYDAGMIGEPPQRPCLECGKTARNEWEHHESCSQHIPITTYLSGVE